MENIGLLFIPDISGFTKFVNETEIDHSRLIIQELLEILINANQIDLQVSEIEGDAILFYKYGEPPGLSELYNQVEKMFCEFNKNLLMYEYRKYCQCRACLTAINLKLKIITHYGEFTSYKVKDFNKLIGKDVIVAHQLLKNEIDNHEYWLLTNNLFKSPPEDFSSWMKWNTSTKETETGNIIFHYAQLGELKNNITPDPFPKLDLSDKTKMFTVSGEYDTDIITLFHATGDFNYRSRWMEGVIKIEQFSHFLPRIGMQCKCIYENGESIIYSSSYSFTETSIEFSETDEKNKTITYYSLQSLDKNKTSLRITIYADSDLITQLIYNLTKKKTLQNKFSNSLKNLTMLVKEIHLPIFTEKLK